jgi:hypothetical protein
MSKDMIVEKKSKESTFQKKKSIVLRKVEHHTKQSFQRTVNKAGHLKIMESLAL